MSQRVTAEYHVLKLVVYEFGWRVVITLDFIADDVSLMANLLLWVDTLEYDVRQQVDGPWQVLFQDGRIEDGILLVGEGIQVTAHLLQTVENL